MVSHHKVCGKPARAAVDAAYELDYTNTFN